MTVLTPQLLLFEVAVETEVVTIAATAGDTQQRIVDRAQQQQGGRSLSADDASGTIYFVTMLLSNSLCLNDAGLLSPPPSAEPAACL